MAAVRHGGLRTFAVIWAGQFVSMLGSSLTSFALAVHVFLLTDSVTTLGIVFALGTVPALLFSPLAGAVVDRWGAHRTLLVTNIGNLLVTMLLAALLLSGAFEVWHVYVLVVLFSVLGALEMPGFGALTPRLVPADQLGRANGMRMLAIAASQVLAPVVSGVLLVSIGLQGIVLIDLVTFGAAILTLVVTRSAAVRTADAADDGEGAALLAGIGEGWRFVRRRRGMCVLLLFVVGVNFSAGLLEVLISPLVLAFASSDALGAILSAGGLGMVVTGIAMSVTGRPRRRVRGMLWATVVLGVATVIGATRPDVVLVAVASCVFMGALGVALATYQGIWQLKVEPRLMGRVLAIVNVVGLVPQMVANLVAGVAVDRVFEPLVGADAVRDPFLAAVVGDGPGRGIALLLLFVGLFDLLVVALVALSPRLRQLEDELPDLSTGDAAAAEDDVAVPRA